MEDTIFTVIKNFFVGTGTFTVALASAGAHLLFAVIFLLFGAIKKGKIAVFRLNILAALFNFSLFFGVLVLTERLDGTGAAALLFSLSVFFLLSIPIAAVSLAKSKEDKEDRAVSDIIDAFSVNTENGYGGNNGYKAADTGESDGKKAGAKTESLYALKKPVKSVKEDGSETDFSHVKNVMERLDYVDLTDTERVEIENLKTLVREAENGGVDDELKRKLNEGLAFVIKVMAKYEL